MSPISQPIAASSSRPRLAITLGDPAGIGPEVVLKALGAQDWSAADITLVGPRRLFELAYKALGRGTGLRGSPPLDALKFLEVPTAGITPEQIQPGEGNAASGAVSFDCLKTAIAQTLAGKFEAIVTAPIAKSAWKAAGHLYPGQTELLAEGAGVNRFGMAFVAQSPHTGWTLRSLLATTHIPLAQVPQVLSPDLMSRKLDLLIECLQQDFGIQAPRIAIAGLNPHSGEQGQLGTEEQDWLIPWLTAQKQRYPHVQLVGPLPPDTMWVLPGQAWYGSHSQATERAHDAYLALYHDQGLIPVKLMAFDRAVNTTIGLPFIRTSPDHGTAFDIAGQGVADPASMIAAIQLAVELVLQRRQNRAQVPEGVA